MTVGIVMAIICVMIAQVYKRDLNNRFKLRVDLLTVWALGIIMWPPAWQFVLGEHTAREFAPLSLAWPVCWLAMEMAAMRRTDPHLAHSSRSTLSIDANGICSLAIALSGVLGAKLGERTQEYAHIFHAAVICCLAFVMPSPHTLASTSSGARVLEAVQKVCLVYSAGFLLAAAILVTTDPGNVQSVQSVGEGGL